MPTRPPAARCRRPSFSSLCFQGRQLEFLVYPVQRRRVVPIPFRQLSALSINAEWSCWWNDPAIFWGGSPAAGVVEADSSPSNFELDFAAEFGESYSVCSRVVSLSI